MKCSLCRNQADMTYEVDRENPKPLCSSCFGRWAPQELDALLGVKQAKETTPPPVAKGTVLSSNVGNGSGKGPESTIHNQGARPQSLEAGPSPEKGEEG